MSTNTNTNVENINEGFVPNINSNSNESKNSNSKKKEQPPQETFYNLCHSLLRFINRKIVKKYVFPNAAQLPKEKRVLELRANNDWKYYLNEDISEEEKIKDVFKDNTFLISLQKMTSSLNEVIDYMDSNKRKINNIEENNKNKNYEESVNKLSEIKDIVCSFFENRNKNDNSDKDKNNIDPNLALGKIGNFFNNNNVNKISENNNMNINNDNYLKNEESTIREETVPIFNSSEPSEKNPKITDKKEIDILIQNFRLDKMNEQEKSNEKINKDKKDDIKDENIFLNKKTERESKSKNNQNKNKKKKTQKEEKVENKENNININEIKNEQINIKTNYPPLKKLFPILKPKEDIDIKNIPIKEKNKENDFDDEIIKELMEEDDGDNSNENNSENEKNSPEKKEVINIDSLPKNTKENINTQTTEEWFDYEMKSHFSENPKNKKSKMGIIMKSIIFSLKDAKILEIKQYNDRMTGPYLAGSFKTFQDLCLMEYPREIDLIYKYKKMLLNEKAMNETVEEVLLNYLELNIIKKNILGEDENKITKMEVECSNKKWGNENIIKFNILFVDTEFGYNEKIIDELILNKKEFLVKTEKEKFINCCLFLRVWRRKNNLWYLIPEILDELVSKNLNQEKTMLTIVLNVFYDLYNETKDFYPKRNHEYISKQKLLCEEIMTSWYNKDNNQKIKDLKNKILVTSGEINKHNSKDLFQI